MTIKQEPLYYQSYIDWIIDEHEKQIALDYFEFAGQKFIVKPTVFNPNIATSSKLFAEEILKLDLTGKRVLDAGCGSGILSIAALKAGASFVYGFDINKAAVETTKENLKRVNMPASNFKVRQADSLPDLPSSFDYIFFNPPFFDTPVDTLWKRSVCDSKRIFFSSVLTQAKKILRPKGKLMMVLGGDFQSKDVLLEFYKQGFIKIIHQKLHIENNLHILLLSGSF